MFVWAHVIAGLFEGEFILSFYETLQALCLLFPIVAIILAWFNKRFAGILVALSGGLLFFDVLDWWKEDDIFFQPYFLIAVGLLLIYLTFNKRKKLDAQSREDLDHVILQIKFGGSGTGGYPAVYLSTFTSSYY